MGRFLDMLRATTSGPALLASIGPTETKALNDSDVKVTSAAGKRGHAYRRIIAHKSEGPFHRQVGIKWLSGESWPMMQTYFKHKFLHATKGWREYVGGPSMRLPMSLRQQRPDLPRSPFREWRSHKRGGALGWRVIPEEAVTA